MRVPGGSGGRFWIGSVVILFLVSSAGRSEAAGSGRYGERYCSEPGFHCIEVKAGDTWESLWPDDNERDIVMKLNRMNIRLRPGMMIAVPDDMSGKTFMDFSPFPRKRDPEPRSGGTNDRSRVFPLDPERNPTAPDFADLENEPFLDQLGRVWDETEELAVGEKVIIWDPKLLAWATYDGNGFLVRWGPAVGGKSYCPDVGRGCRTKTGVTRIFSKRGPHARSSKYPIGCSGRSCAPVPFFMEFFRSYGFHASTNVPGYHASHGCVRMFYEDAKWMNEEFAQIGTKVIILPY